MRKFWPLLLVLFVLLVGCRSGNSNLPTQPTTPAQPNPVVPSENVAITVLGTTTPTVDLFATPSVAPTVTPIPTIDLDLSTNEGIVRACGDLEGTQLRASPQRSGEFVQLDSANTGNAVGKKVRTFSVIGNTVWGGNVGGTNADSAAFVIDPEAGMIYSCGRAVGNVIQGHVNVIRKIMDDILIGIDGAEAEDVSGVLSAAEQWANNLNNAPNDNRVYDIAVVGEGGFWDWPEGTKLGAMYAGIEVNQPPTNTWELNNRMFNDGIQGNAPSLHALLIAGDELWVVTQKIGVMIIRFENRVYSYERINVANGQLESDDGRVIIEVGDYRYVGSDGGLSRFQISTEKWEILDPPNKRVTGFATDAEGRLWMSTMGGVYYSEDHGMTWTNFYPACPTLSVAILGENIFLATDGCYSQWSLIPE